MPAIITLADLKTYLGDAPASSDDALLSELIDDVEAIFATDCGRLITAFQAAGTARTEVQDATGSAELWLDYPIAVLTSVTLGYDPTQPDEAPLVVSDKQTLVYSVGERRLTRTDGGTFGRVGQRRYVQIVYDFQADVPVNAKLALKSVAAAAYRRRGSEEVKSESVGGFYSRTMIEEIATTDPFWQTAITANARVQFA